MYKMTSETVTTFSRIEKEIMETVAADAVTVCLENDDVEPREAVEATVSKPLPLDMKTTCIESVEQYFEAHDDQ